MILDIILILLLSFFVLLSAILGFRLITLRNDLAEFRLRAALLEQNIKQVMEKSPPAIENSEGFLKFVSDSRDWAFQYIEEVQSGLNEFITEVEPLVQYFDKYGDQMGMTPNYEGMKKVSSEFKKLKELLPENDGSQ